MEMHSTDWRAEVRRQNDRFRKHGEGQGTFLVTSGISAKGPAFVLAAVRAVRAFDAFTKDNDPYGEHDFGAFNLEGERLFFKIDPYDLSLQAYSPNAADPAKAKRVLTLMLASEY